MKKVLVTWGYDENGKRYLDNYLEIYDTDLTTYFLDGNSKFVSFAESFNAIKIRMRAQRTKACLFIVDDWVGREEMESIVKTNPKALKQAMIRM